MVTGKKISKAKLNAKIKELPVPVQEHCKRCRLIATFLLERIKGEDWFFDAKLNAEHIVSAVFLHDIGKVNIPKENLYAEHNVTKPKQAAYRSHVEEGVKLINDVCDIDLASFGERRLERYVFEAITEHHESADGCGFPKRLTSKTSSVTGKIAAIADTVDNLFFVGATEARDYAALTEQLAGMAGVELDEFLLSAMLADREAFLGFIQYVDTRYQNKRKTDNYGLQLRFAPIMNIIENDIREAYVDFLINDPFYGLVKPQVYLPVANMSSQISRLTLLMVERLCLTLDKIRERGEEAIPVSLAIEAKCFETKKFVPEMIKLIERYHLDDGEIGIVIDEGQIGTLEEADLPFRDLLATLNNGGYRVAMKMMAEGASLIGSLDTLPVDYIYIDPTYTRRLSENSNTYGVASGLLDIAHNLHLSVVFLGVDSRAAEKTLLKMHARYGTGALYGEPMRENEFVSFSVNGRKDAAV